MGARHTSRPQAAGGLSGPCWGWLGTGTPSASVLQRARAELLGAVSVPTCVSASSFHKRFGALAVCRLWLGTVGTCLRTSQARGPASAGPCQPGRGRDCLRPLSPRVCLCLGGRAWSCLSECPRAMPGVSGRAICGPVAMVWRPASPQACSVVSLLGFWAPPTPPPPPPWAWPPWSALPGPGPSLTASREPSRVSGWVPGSLAAAGDWAAAPGLPGPTSPQSFHTAIFSGRWLCRWVAHSLPALPRALPGHLAVPPLPPPAHPGAQ